MALILNLDEAVADENLPKLGELFFEVTANNNFPFTYQTNNSTEFTARIIGEGNFFTDNTYTTSAGKSVTQTTNTLYLSAGTYKVGITQKYIVRDIGNDFALLNNEAAAFDCAELKYCEFPVACHFSHWKLNNFSGDNMSQCVLLNASGCTSLEVDVAEFKKLPATLASVNIGTTGCYGDLVEAFGDKINLALLAASSNNCTGTYQDVCDAMFANGRTSGTMTIVTNDGSGVHTVTFTSSGWTA